MRERRGGRARATLLLPSLASAPAARADSLRISVFGDSVLLGAAGAIQSTLAGNNVTVDAHENLSLLGALGTLQAARPDIGDVVVLDLGYNDGPDPGVWRNRVDQAMAILAGVPKVIWLNQANFADGRARDERAARGAAQQYPNLEVADWSAVVAAHPDSVYTDGMHLTAAGQAAMADLVRQRVDAFVAARTAATSTTVAPASTTVAHDDHHDRTWFRWRRPHRFTRRVGKRRFERERRGVDRGGDRRRPVGGRRRHRADHPPPANATPAVTETD